MNDLRRNLHNFIQLFQVIRIVTKTDFIQSYKDFQLAQARKHIFKELSTIIFRNKDLKF